MLAAPAAFQRRIATRICAPVVGLGRRAYAQGKAGNERSKHAGRKKRAEGKEKGNGTTYTPPSEDSTEAAVRRPTLIEQLFPERYATAKAQPEPTREVPPLEVPSSAPPPGPESRWTPEQGHGISQNELMRRKIAAQPPNTSVLVLRNAGKNLTEEDFRRVIPQGKHLEGWTLEQGDILRAVPGRNLETLEPTGDYYLLFSTPLSAFTYQSHVMRIHRMVVANAPSSLLSSPIAPPPGYQLEGMDAHDAINSFTLLAPDQALQLRQLKPPLAPAMQFVVKHGGFERLMQRKERMPFEVRLTLEGPQLQLPFIRHVLRTSARDRGLGWSTGADDELPRLSQWEPMSAVDMPSLSNKGSSAKDWAENHHKRGIPLLASKSSNSARASNSGDASTEDAFGAVNNADELRKRTPRPVYIAGFAAEQAMQSFMHFWHGRPMAWSGADRAGGGGTGDEEGDAPPVAHVQVLW